MVCLMLRGAKPSHNFLGSIKTVAFAFVMNEEFFLLLLLLADFILDISFFSTFFLQNTNNGAIIQLYI